MSILNLHINGLRNIASAVIDCSSHFNLLSGDNAAGKTSALEAIYYLSTGKSFRTHHADRIIHYTQDKMTVFARLITHNGEISIGLQRTRNGALQIRVNEETVKSIADISHFLPVQFIGADSHRILSDGPKCRRQFLDWGLFYTCPTFYTQWKSFQKILLHRNAALKARAAHAELLIWNHEFAVAGEALDTLRQNYINQFLPFFRHMLASLLPSVSIDVQYSSGWDKNNALLSCLNQNVSRETLFGYSLYGPHRADLLLIADGLPAHDSLSQGQQKLVSYALRLSQGVHLQSTTEKTPIFLIDDLPSELDLEKRHLITKILSTIQAQVFITGIEAADLDEILLLHPENKMFHVKHGVISHSLYHYP